MALISPNLIKHDIQFLLGDDLGSDHPPIEISIDAHRHRNTHTNPIRYKFDQTDREVLESTPETALSSGDIPELKVQMKCFFITEFESAAEIRKNAVDRFLISLLVPEL